MTNDIWCPECGGDYLRFWTLYRNSNTDIDEILQCQDCKAYWKRNFVVRDGKIVITMERFFFG